jgi:hypothetical protein
MSLVDRILGPSQTGTLHEICALLREQNTLLRLLATAQGINVNQVPRVQGQVTAPRRRGPLDASAVSLGGRKAQIQREYQEQERQLFPHRSGPPTDPTPESAGNGLGSATAPPPT